MKKTVFLLALAVSAPALSGDKIGNGGGLWVCRDKYKNIVQAELVDLYEARVEFDLPPLLTHSKTAKEIFEDRKFFLQTYWPEFLQDIGPSLREVETRLRFVAAELEIVDDTLFRTRPLPETCENPWQYLQFANFTHQGQVLIRKDIWENTQVTAIHKAALLWHEAIYHWMRLKYQDQDSVRTRQIVGLLFSNSPPTQIRQEIGKVLALKPTPGPQPSPTPDPEHPVQQWICTAKNAASQNLFRGYGTTEIEARSIAVNSCGAENHAIHCQKSQQKCEKILSEEEAFICSSENLATRTEHLGRGRNKLEAEFESLIKCGEENSAVNCKKPICQRI